MKGNLNNQSLPTETTLEVLWNIEEYIFTFKMNMKEKPKTRRDMLSALSSVYVPLHLSFFKEEEYFDIYVKKI